MLRLADVLSSLSLATDLAIGAPLETAQRMCLVATHLGRRLGLPAPRLGDAFYAALLRHVGCTEWAHEAAELVGGDDHDVIRTFESVDRARKAAVIGRALSLGKSRGPARRVRAIAGVLAQPAAGPRLAAAQCAQAEALAGDLGLGPGVVTALGQMYERHDGRGAPNGLRGDEIAVEARLLAAAQLVEALQAGKLAGLAAGEVVALRRAALVHDLGAVTVPNGVWEPTSRSNGERHMDGAL